MKNKIIFLLCMLSLITITACSKYEKDESYNTDLYGSYSQSMEATNTQYSFNEKYIFNNDDSYFYSVKEIIGTETTKDTNKDGKIISIQEISNNITKITLDQEIIEWSTGETSNQVIYKYRNIIGVFYETEVPKGKTFNLFLKNKQSSLNEGNVFDEKGSYHYCSNYDNCTCDEDNFVQYVRKDNIIYFQSIDEEHKKNYCISMYVIDDGIFFPELYRREE